MIEHEIRSNEAGQRLDKFLGKYMPLAPKSFFYKMLRKKNITLNGKKAAGQEKLAEGDRIRFFLSDETVSKFTGPARTTEKQERKRPASPPVELDILYEDRHTLFINKPAGMLSQKAAADDVSLVEYVTGYLLKSGQITDDELHTFHPAVCNRLDRNTSGIVAAGKTLAALQELNAMFRDRTLRKYYLCLVAGSAKDGAHIDGYLVKDPKTNRVSFSKTETAGSVRIETEYRPLCEGEGATLLEVHLITGKTHQIRAHMAAQGHPIIGDYKYGNRKINDRYRSAYGLTSQLLHAARLCIPQQDGVLAGLSGKTVFAPLPELFRRICLDRHIRKDYLTWPHGIQEDSGDPPWKNS